MAVVVVGMMCSCGNRGPITDCIIISKDHTGAWTHTSMVMAGKALVPITTHHPESWRLTISGKTEDGEYISRSISVSRDEYSRVDTNQKYRDLM